MVTPAIDETEVVRRRKGQTLAEFAITLPILLILTFGIIEFGRIFQAWVTLQNSARVAARYASTGAYDSRFRMDTSGLDDPDGFIPCTYNDDRGAIRTYDDGTEGTLIYDGGPESLFATWWSGVNCTPNNREHQDMRKDIARLLSIQEQARIGAAGLAVNYPSLDMIAGPNEIKSRLYRLWNRPAGQAEGSDQPSWFDVMICSSRPGVTSSDGLYSGHGRYIAVINAVDSATFGGAPYPACIMNEVASGPGMINNAGKPWLDPGDAGDTVTVVVTFNHPLITPLGLAEYVQIQAQKTGVNETFRVVRAREALLLGGPIGEQLNVPPQAILSARPQDPVANPNYTTNAAGDPVRVILDGVASFDPDNSLGQGIVSWRWTWGDGNEGRTVGADVPLAGPDVNRLTTVDLPPGNWNIRLTVYDAEGAEGTTTITVLVRLPATPTPVNTATPTSTFTPSPEPFSCDRISVGDLYFTNNRVNIRVRNDNAYWDSELLLASLNWPTINDFPDMYISTFALDVSVHWRGIGRQSPTATNIDPNNPPDLFDFADRAVNRSSSRVWSATFVNGPFQLATYATMYDFRNSRFVFRNPTGGPDCEKLLELPEPTPIPELNPNDPTPTASFTPECVGPLLQPRFVEFRSFGVVRLDVVNNRTTTAILNNFQISWRQVPGLTLEKVTVGGNGPVDQNTVMVWSAPFGQDANPPTTGRSEGTWHTNFTFPPQSITPLYLDFGGTTTTIQADFGISSSDFNGSWFQFGCGGNSSGGTGGSGGVDTNGIIHLWEENTPEPTWTPGPSTTPRPTNPPRPTKTPGPAQPTPLPPPTSAPQPTQPPPPNTPVPVFTLPPVDDGGTIE